MNSNLDKFFIFLAKDRSTILTTISSAFFKVPNNGDASRNLNENCCLCIQSCMNSIRNKLSSYGNTGHSCILYFCCGFFIHMPFGLLLQNYFFSTYIKSTTINLMFFSVISYFVGVLLYLLFAFFYYWVSFLFIISSFWIVSHFNKFFRKY